MAVIDATLAGGLNVVAFMDTLASNILEGTASSPITRHDGYDVIVSGIDGRHVFTDFSDHPFAVAFKDGGPAPIVVNNKGLESTASGRYQFLRKDWAHYRAQLRLPDFSPLSQDKWCIQLLRERRAVAMLQQGDVRAAAKACANIWASLPGDVYGQQTSSHRTTMDQVVAMYKLCGGTVK